MPQVPYAPIPDVAPQDAPIPQRRLDTPGAAFGTTIAAATQHLGDVTDQAGSEVFQRGIAMQDLYNHSQAIEATTNLQKSVGDIHAKLSAMQGKDAVDYYSNGYITDINKAKEDIRNTLPNPMAQKIYDEGASSVIGRTIFNGAGHAAIENKQYAIGAAAAQGQEIDNRILANPLDDNGFQQGLKEKADATTAQLQLKGEDPGTIAVGVHTAQGQLYAKRIEGLVITYPFQAEKILRTAAAEGKINGDDLGRLTNLVQGATHTVGARNLSSEVRSGSDLSPGAGIVSTGAAKAAIGGFESGNNYQSQGVEVFDKDGNSRGRALGKYQVMPANLGPWLKDAGLPSMTPAQFLASPSAQDKVFETKFGQFMTQTGSFNDAASMWFSGKTVAQAGNVKDANGTSVPGYLAGTNRILAQNAPLADQVAKVRQRAGELAPDDPTMADYAQERITADYDQNLKIKRADEFDQRQTIAGAITNGVNGKPAMNIDELTSTDPKVEAAVNALLPTDRIKLEKDIRAYANAATTQTQKERSHTLLGMAYGSAEDVDKFLNTNVFQEPLSQPDMKTFHNLQTQLMKQRGGDDTIQQALKQVEPLLSIAGADVKDKDLMNRFRGSYIEAVQDWRANNPSKGLDNKTARELATDIMQKESSPNFWYGKDYMFNLPLPTELETEIKAKNPNISDPELELYRQEFVRQQLQALQKSKKSAQQ